ncbi:GNAT family N-acetyltransferase [Chitinophaga parva]|uniref:GNAT family N-acetyltransferase n=1 Tax=Chitinophaga parva TaxID=2169414 RepID=A0A2T7BG78_9BACT|nr:GNAT family N-acetyltransferase [Chitinophaga parva]PUZ25292.1 GNAT family N-acetyltransferase [Chitinophaga parva]
MNYHIATLQDIPTIQALAHKIWARTYAEILSPAQMTYMLDMMYGTPALAAQITDDHYTFLVFREEDQPAGYAAFSPHAEQGVYKLHKIYLDTDLQGKGLGKTMMNTVKDLVAEKGAHTLELDVNRHNKALYFYKKQGFAVVGEKDTHIGNDYYMNDYVMRIPL